MTEKQIESIDSGISGVALAAWLLGIIGCVAVVAVAVQIDDVEVAIQQATKAHAANAEMMADAVRRVPVALLKPPPPAPPAQTCGACVCSPSEAP